MRRTRVSADVSPARSPGLLSLLFASCLARGIAGVALRFLLDLLGGFALLLFGCGALGRQSRFALSLCRRFGFARFAFGLIGLADFSRGTAIGGVRRARLQALGGGRIGSLGAKSFQRRLLGLGGGLLPFLEIRLSEPSHLSRPRRTFSSDYSLTRPPTQHRQGAAPEP